MFRLLRRLRRPRPFRLTVLVEGDRFALGADWPRGWGGPDRERAATAVGCALALLASPRGLRRMTETVARAAGEAGDDGFARQVARAAEEADRQNRRDADRAADDWLDRPAVPPAKLFARPGGEGD